MAYYLNTCRKRNAEIAFPEDQEVALITMEEEETPTNWDPKVTQMFTEEKDPLEELEDDESVDPEMAAAAFELTVDDTMGMERPIRPKEPNHWMRNANAKKHIKRGLKPDVYTCEMHLKELKTYMDCMKVYVSHTDCCEEPLLYEPSHYPDVVHFCYKPIKPRSFLKKKRGKNALTYRERSEIQQYELAIKNWESWSDLDQMRCDEVQTYKEDPDYATQVGCPTLRCKGCRNGEHMFDCTYWCKPKKPIYDLSDDEVEFAVAAVEEDGVDTGNAEVAAWCTECILLSRETGNKVTPNTWLADSGASSHMVYDCTRMHKLEKIHKPVKVRNKGTMFALAKGKLDAVVVQKDGTQRSITFTDVLCVPNLGYNLCSLNKAWQSGNYELRGSVQSGL